MAVRNLTAKQVAELHGMTTEALLDDLAAGAFPAPTIFTKAGVAKWKAADVAEPVRRTPSPDSTRIRLTRSQELDYLYDEVCYYVMQHGTARVPQNVVGRPSPNGEHKPFPLGQRISSLRGAYRRGRVSPETAERFEKLPGWAWDHRIAEWTDRFHDVASRWPDETTESDRVWVTSQRLRLKVLGPERIAMLESVPGMLEISTGSKVDLFIRAAELWLADHPDRDASRIPYRVTQEVDGKTIKLGRLVTYYRRRYRGLEGKSKVPLSAEEVAKFEKLPGWTWKPAKTQERNR